MSYAIDITTSNIVFYENYSARLNALMGNIKIQIENLDIDMSNADDVENILNIKSEIDCLQSHHTNLNVLWSSNSTRIYNLHIQLQKHEAEAQAQAEAQVQAEAEAQAQADAQATFPVRSKLKWVSSENEETYRVVIVTKKGFLQVKSVKDGAGECHDYDCPCVPCWENAHSAPWRPRRPLKKTFFATLNDWYMDIGSDSYNLKGLVTMTPPN
jgi:hypothetical protein